MTDRPILFSSAMVRSILSGSKTQTRRLVKPQPMMRADGLMDYRGDIISFDSEIEPPCIVGDRLWVREAWRMPANWDDRSPSQTVASCREAGLTRPWAPIAWDADGKRTNWGDGREANPGRLRASMHLPRVYSRITLIVNDVRIQRLRDISEDDARAEGCEPTTCSNVVAPDDGFPSYRSAFGILWDSLAKPGMTWADNPWVAAITFDAHRCNIDAMEAAHD